MDNVYAFPGAAAPDLVAAAQTPVNPARSSSGGGGGGGVGYASPGNGGFGGPAPAPGVATGAGTGFGGVGIGASSGVFGGPAAMGGGGASSPDANFGASNGPKGYASPGMGGLSAASVAAGQTMGSPGPGPAPYGGYGQPQQRAPQPGPGYGPGYGSQTYSQEQITPQPGKLARVNSALSKVPWWMWVGGAVVTAWGVHRYRAGKPFIPFTKGKAAKKNPKRREVIEVEAEES